MQYCLVSSFLPIVQEISIMIIGKRNTRNEFIFIQKGTSDITSNYRSAQEKKLFIRVHSANKNSQARMFVEISRKFAQTIFFSPRNRNSAKTRSHFKTVNSLNVCFI